MSCSFRRTPSAAILAVAAAFISGGMDPAINANGELLYKTAGGGCAAYLIATPEMQKIMAMTTHQKHNVCGLRTDLEVRVSDVIIATNWTESEREMFVQGLQDAHDSAAKVFKTLIDYGMDKISAKQIFNFALKSALNDLASEYDIKVKWPNEITKLAHKANSNRPPTRKNHRKQVLEHQTV